MRCNCRPGPALKPTTTTPPTEDFVACQPQSGTRIIRSGASEVFGLKVNRCTLTSQGVKDQGALTREPLSVDPEVHWLKGPESQRFVGQRSVSQGLSNCG